jgi:hypothetical protein
LKHMVKDKVNYRARGPNTQLTRQPVSGRANDGGLRIGEMERDVVISHGASEFLRESLMERADKYQIAICNTTGMMAIYNPSKDIFMSPMADGPLKFTGSLDGKEQHLEQVSRFGRNFSIVNVPYAFKLLLQELQTMNVQMRIITDDNIEQLESMSYSNNINKLMFTQDFTPQEILRFAKNNIHASRLGNLKTPVVEKAIPEIIKDSPEIIKDSPEFAPYSPYEPTANDIQASTMSDSLRREIYGTPSAESNENGMVQTSPEFAPYSPYQPTEEDLQASTVSGSLRREIYGTPIPEKTEYNELSKQAREYSIGEQVYYRGDEIPNRKWIVSNIGDRFIKIESNTPGLNDPDTIKLVTALDIYKSNNEYYDSPSDSVGSYNTLPPPPPLGSPSPETIMNGGRPNFIGSNGMHHPQPINIKIINNGNEYSNEGIMPDTPTYTSDNNVATFKPPIQDERVNIDIQPSSHTDSGKLDFDKLVVKKI